MNCQMTQITVTYRDGRMATLENVYIRGSKIRFLILPDMLKNAPMFKNKSGNKSGTAGRGKSAILRAQGESEDLNFSSINSNFFVVCQLLEEEDAVLAGRVVLVGKADQVGEEDRVVNRLVDEAVVAACRHRPLIKTFKFYFSLSN